MRHINIPLFIQHMGCPNQCVFCDQRAITGAHSFCFEKVIEDIEKVLATKGDAEAEIAFFGGSFTGIDRDLMIRLLDIAEGYVKKGEVVGIRMSTRPDYINEEILDILDRYTITEIELGIQSLDDEVLTSCRRGHIAADTEKSCKLLRERGYKFIGQMMTGLPAATHESEIFTARRICEMGAVGTRIYPLVVFKNTPLAEMTRRGEYTPMSLEEAIERSANVYEVFLENNVKCLKIGLHETENLHSEESYMAGPNHPALGEMVRSEIYRRRIMSAIKTDTSGKNLEIYVPKGRISMAVGQKSVNKARIMKETWAHLVKILEKDELLEYNVLVNVF
jgi:histone acetyltransferase (RNA polymerase elongator complex component)